MYYFPALLQKKFPSEISKHQLRREIVATRLANSLTNRVGSHFVFITAEQTGKNVASIARIYHLVRAAYNLHTVWQEIESLDNRVPAQSQTKMFLIINRMMDYIVLWFLTQAKVPEKLAVAIDYYCDAVERLAAWLTNTPSAISAISENTQKELTSQGVPPALAFRMSIMPYLSLAPDLARLAERSDCAIEQAATVFFGLGQRLSLSWLRERVQSLSGPDTPWQRDAVTALLEDILTSQRLLTAQVMSAALPKQGKKKDEIDPLHNWLTKNSERLERFDKLLGEIRASSVLDLAMLTLASRHLSALVK